MLKSSGHFRAFNLLGSKSVQLGDVSDPWERGCDLLIFDIGRLSSYNWNFFQIWSVLAG